MEERDGGDQSNRLLSQSHLRVRPSTRPVRVNPGPSHYPVYTGVPVWTPGSWGSILPDTTLSLPYPKVVPTDVYKVFLSFQTKDGDLDNTRDSRGPPLPFVRMETH